MAATIICPACDWPLAYADRLVRHLREEPTHQRVTSLDVMVTRPLYSLVVDGNGVVWQKRNNNELCWFGAGNEDPISAYGLLIQGHQPIVLMAERK